MFTVEEKRCKLDRGGCKKATLMSFLQLTLLFYFKEEDVT